MLEVRRLPSVLCVSALLVMVSAVPSSADLIITLEGDDFSDPTNNTGGNITVTISDIVGGVELLIENNLADATAYPKEMFFNTTVAALTAPAGSCVSCASVNNAIVAGSFQFGLDAHKADGDGFFDIRIEFPDAPPADRLTPGESITLQILSSTTGFNAASFAAFSAPAPGGGHGPFEAAAHIGALPPNEGGSDWIAGSSIEVFQVPEPSALLLVSAGVLGYLRRKRTRL